MDELKVYPKSVSLRKNSSRRFRFLFLMYFLLALLAGRIVVIQLQKVREGLPESNAQSITASVNGFVLPSTTIKNHGGVVVQMCVNNHTNRYFVVDTGAGPSVFSPRLVKAMGLRTKPNPEFTLNSEARSSKRIKTLVHIDRLSGGGLNLLDITGPVSNVASEVIRDKTKTLDGIIGANILKHFAVVFDFENKRLLFVRDGNLSNKQLKELGVAGGKNSGITMQSMGSDNGFLFRVPAHVKINKRDAYFPLIVDTGTPYTLLLDPTNSLEIPTERRSRPQTQYGMNCAVQCFSIPVSSFGIGSEQTVADFSGVTPFVCTVTYDTRNGKSLLGMDYLSRFRVIIDYPAQRFYMTPVAHQERQANHPLREIVK